MKYVPKPYHARAIKFTIANPYCGLFLDMGLGKTGIILEAIRQLMDFCETRGVLIVAPKRVCELVWRQEAKKWESPLKIRLAVGTLAEFRRAIERPSDIWLTNYERLKDLVDWMETNQAPFDMIVWDESSKMKSHSAKRFKLMKPHLAKFHRGVLLTGTPAPRSYLNLWSQIFLLDRGQRLYPFITRFKDRYFERKNPRDFFTWTIKDGCAAIIEARIKDLILCMRSEDYIDMPPVIYNTVSVELPKKLKGLYKKFEADMFMMIRRKEVLALNAAALSMKCRQLTSGAMYHEDGSWSALHEEKLDALEDILEDAQGNPVLIVYEFKSELARLMKRWPGTPYIGGGSKNADKIVDDWNAGKLQRLFVHPASVGHGVNMQFGGHIMVFTSGTWDLELLQQTVKRLHRPGQKHPVVVHFLVCPGTVDVVLQRALGSKEKSQNALLDALTDLMR
jgi:SNF2 family DNA or RNA helicase